VITTPGVSSSRQARTRLMPSAQEAGGDQCDVAGAGAPGIPTILGGD
jgi:hypothetical protein